MKMLWTVNDSRNIYMSGNLEKEYWVKMNLLRILLFTTNIDILKNCTK